MKVTPYLNFDGNCRAAFEFYADTLGGTIDAMMTHAESPIAAEVSPDWHDLILHAYLVADDVVLMGGDAPPGHYNGPGTYYISLSVEAVDEAERIFAALAEGGTTQMAMEETFWSPRFGMCVDRFGTPWMVNCEPS